MGDTDLKVVETTDHNEPVKTGETASKTDGQGTTTPPVEESFSSIDTTKLSPELQAVYKSMQADYTKKMQSIAQDKQYSDLYKKIAGDEAFVKYWNSLSKEDKKDVSEAKTQQEITDEEFADAFTSKDKFIALQQKLADTQLSGLKQELGYTQKQLQVREAERTIDAFAEMKDENGQLLHPLYTEMEELGLIEYFLGKEPPVSADQYPAVLDKVYKEAQKVYDNIYSKGKNAGLGRVQEKVNDSSISPSSVQPPADVIDFKNLSVQDQVREAVRIARKRVSK